MAKRKGKYTSESVRKAYQRERQRLLSAKRRAEKGKDVVKTFEIPNPRNPSRVTAWDVKALQKISTREVSRGTVVRSMFGGTQTAYKEALKVSAYKQSITKRTKKETLNQKQFYRELAKFKEKERNIDATYKDDYNEHIKPIPDFDVIDKVEWEESFDEWGYDDSGFEQLYEYLMDLAQLFTTDNAIFDWQETVNSRLSMMQSDPDAILALQEYLESPQGVKELEDIQKIIFRYEDKPYHPAYHQAFNWLANLLGAKKYTFNDSLKHSAEADTGEGYNTY